MPDPDTIAPFAALKPPAVAALARILFLKHATTAPKTLAAYDSWLANQRRQVAALRQASASASASAAASSVCRQGTLSLMADVFFRGALARPHEVLLAQETAALCASHRDLNPHVLAALMQLLTEESTLHVDALRLYAQREGRALGLTNGAVDFWLKSIAQIPALWMGKARWEEKMQRDLAVHIPALARHRSCVACKLAAVGGSIQFLMDLRTSLLARHDYALEMHWAMAARPRPRRPPPPLLLRMVDAWISVCYTAPKRARIRTQSELLLPMVVALRGAAARADVGVVTVLCSGGYRQLGKMTRAQEEERKHTRRGWPMPLTPLMEVDVDDFVDAVGEEDGGGGSDGYIEEDGYIAGRWRRRKRTMQMEGYSQYLEQDTLPVIMGRLGEETARGKPTQRLWSGAPRRSASPPPPPASVCATTAATIDTAPVERYDVDEEDRERQNGSGWKPARPPSPWVMDEEDLDDEEAQSPPMTMSSNAAPVMPTTMSSTSAPRSPVPVPLRPGFGRFVDTSALGILDDSDTHSVYSMHSAVSSSAAGGVPGTPSTAAESVAASSLLTGQIDRHAVFGSEASSTPSTYYVLLPEGSPEGRRGNVPARHTTSPMPTPTTASGTRRNTLPVGGRGRARPWSTNIPVPRRSAEQTVARPRMAMLVSKNKGPAARGWEERGDGGEESRGRPANSDGAFF